MEACSRLNTVCLEIIILMWEPRIHLRHIDSWVQNVQLFTDAYSHKIIMHRCRIQFCQGIEAFSLSSDEKTQITAEGTGQ